MASIAEARDELMSMRAGGQAWGGLVVAYTVEQAKRLAAAIREEYGDNVMLVVADRDTAKAVAKFTADTSQIWIVSITKVSEGISITIPMVPSRHSFR